MNTDLPPLECPKCHKPIWPTEPFTTVTGSKDETGEVVAGPIAYHADCAPEPGQPPA